MRNLPPAPLYVFIPSAPKLICIQEHVETKLLLYFTELNSCNGTIQQNSGTGKKVQEAPNFQEEQKSEFLQSQSYTQN